MAQENTSTENIAQYWDDAIQGRLNLYQHLSPHDPPDVQSSAHQRITSEISALRRGISSLNSRLNALTPVALLPPEILADCFEILACIDEPANVSEPESHLERAQQRHLGWITVTHVSSRWREVALNRPSLWATISFRLGPTWTSVMLSRARDTPLVIRDELYPEPAGSEMRCMIDVLRCHLSRTRLVDIRGGIPASVASSFEEALTTPSATLESITIRLPSTDEDIFLPDNFLGNYAPCLRKVDFLFSHSSYWTRPVFKDLTHICIIISSPHPALQDYTHFFDMMDQNPSLQSIELDNALPHVPNPLQHQRRVMLAHLQSFAFYGLPSSCAELLHTFEVPLDVKLKLSIDSTIDAQPESRLKVDYSALCHTLKSLNESHKKSPFRTLVFLDFGSPGPDDDVRIKAYRSAGWVFDHSQFASFDDDVPSLSLYVVPAIVDRPGHGASACRILPSLPFKDIDTFIIVDGLSIPRSWCDPFSMGLPNIQYFQLNGVNLEQAFVLLCLPFSSSELDSTTMPATFTVFPRLTHLQLHSEYLEKLSQGLQDGLLAMLYLRKNHGAPLKWLGLKGFHLSQKALDGLRPLVPVVVIDKE